MHTLYSCYLSVTGPVGKRSRFLQETMNSRHHIIPVIIALVTTFLPLSCIRESSRGDAFEAAFSLDTNPMEKRRMILLCIIGTLASLLWGTLLPLELILLILCPLLFAFHVSCTGILYMTLQSLHIYLGYQSTDTITLTARPGSLPEFISYIQYPALARSLIGVAVAGIVTGAIYFLVTRLYFRYLAMDLFKTGSKDEVISAVIKAAGGIENIKMTNSSIAKLTLSVYDPGKVDVQRLRRLGSHRIYENRAGFNICFGAPSTMIRLGIDSAMRDAVREVNRM